MDNNNKLNQSTYKVTTNTTPPSSLPMNIISRRLIMSHFPDSIDIHILVDTITLLLNLYDNYTAGHSNRVAYLAEKISRLFDRSEKDHQRLHIAAHLHDIGKISIPSEILNKESRLTEEEFKVVQHHSERGYEVINQVESLSSIAPTILHHHERYDGTGYPHGLREEEIPFDSRIIAIADAYDAMISVRPYQRSLSFKEAITEIINGAGTQFDPFIVRNFKEMVLNSKTECLYEDLNDTSSAMPISNTTDPDNTFFVAEEL